VSFDPWSLLGLEPSASVADVDAAFAVAAARASTDEVLLARLEAARTMLLDPRARARARLFGPPPFADLGEVADALTALPRRPAGAALWLEAIAENR